MSDSIQRKAVEKAIKFLDAAGASYTIRFDGELLTNRETRPDYKSIYGPAIDTAVQEGKTMVVIRVPEEFEIAKFRSAFAATLNQRFGNDHSMTEINTEARTVTALWITE